MVEVNALPVSGGIIVAGALWAGISAFALGPLVAERTIERSGWHQQCPAQLQQSLRTQEPSAQSRPNIGCNDVMKLFGPEGQQLCGQGGDVLFDLFKFDPLAQQKARLRRLKQAQLARLAERAPDRCSCAASVVASDRFGWGLHAGSARLINKPQNLQADLVSALHTPVCARLWEGGQ